MRTFVKKPEISVVIPVYNMELYVGQSIESVLNQSFKNFELIVVNDGSTDHSLQIIEVYAERDKRIRIVNKPNAGLASAYNAGQQRAQGKYIYFLDSDDWMEPNCLEVMYKVAEEFQTDVVKAWGCLIKEMGRVVEFRTISPQYCGKLITNMLSFPEFVSRHVAQWTCLYRRDFLLENEIWSPEFPPKIAPDIDFMYHVWAKCKRLFVVPGSFIHYRLDNENSDKNSGSKMSFYLLRGHLVARANLAKLHLPKAFWNVKTMVEYQHFLFELETHRCCTNRWEYLHGIAKIFRENIHHGLINWADLSKSDMRKYKLIAYAPWLYWLNDTVWFWTIRRERLREMTTYLRFFGLYRRIEDRLKTKIYLCGFLVWEYKNG